MESLPRAVISGDIFTDLDGDGPDEVGQTTTLTTEDDTGFFVIVEGADLMGGGSLLDVGHYAWFEEAEPRNQGFPSHWADTEEGDIDGDGLADLAFGATSMASTKIAGGGQLDVADVLGPCQGAEGSSPTCST